MWAWLGKTITTLKAIEELLRERFEITRVLVIAPIRVCAVWAEEIAKWELPLTINIAVGTPKERAAAFWTGSDIVAINRENVVWAFENGFLEGFDMLVVDEASSFKSYSAKRTKVLIKARTNFERIVELSATPTSNGLLDIFSQYRILDGGERLGRFIGQYRERFFKPDKTNGSIVYSYKLRYPENEQAIYDLIMDITVSMKAEDYLDMPELLTVTHKVVMTEKERKIYDDLKSKLTVDVGDAEITAFNAAGLCSKLCQMSNGFLYGEDKQAVQIHDHKLDVLEDLIEQQNGRPLLVFYWFKEDYKKICERLDKLKIVYGNLADKGGIEKWNNDKFLVGLAQPASLGHGINIQYGSANSMCWYGLTWSLELREQAIARIYRQGQKSKTIFIHDIVCENTVDERIQKSMVDKNSTQEALIAAVKAVLN